MTEPEIVEMLNSQWDLCLSGLSLYMTVTSAYLVVAYLAGSKLDTSQVSIISTLYIFMALVCTYSVFGWSSRGTHYAGMLREIESNSPTYVNQMPIVPVIMAVILAGGIFASLKFMWDIRNPRTG